VSRLPDPPEGHYFTVDTWTSFTSHVVCVALHKRVRILFVSTSRLVDEERIVLALGQDAAKVAVIAAEELLERYEYRNRDILKELREGLK
jgi:hypothetical protein